MRKPQQSKNSRTMQNLFLGGMRSGFIPRFVWILVCPCIEQVVSCDLWQSETVKGQQIFRLQIGISQPMFGMKFDIRIHKLSVRWEEQLNLTVWLLGGVTISPSKGELRS